MKSHWFIKSQGREMSLSNYNKFHDDEGISLRVKIMLASFVLLYPLLVSMYTFLPPLIGIVGYILIVNVNVKENFFYVVSAFIFLLNLDLNLRLPLFLSTVVISIIYIFIYPRLKRLVRCRACLLFAIIVLIDLFYYAMLFIYDLLFGSSTIIADMLLLYYIVVDILIGVML